MDATRPALALACKPPLPVLAPLTVLQMCGCGVVCAEDIPYSFILDLASASEASKDSNSSTSNEEKVA
jgi:hypothetical protein